MLNSDFEKSAFFGEVTASVAHELQNVLAIVKETAGLMQDHLAMTGDVLPPEIAETFSKTIFRIQKQVERGVGITSGLNGFAHTADAPFVGMDIVGAIQRLVFLSSRIFQNKAVSIEIDVLEKPLLVEVDPLCFQMLVFKCIQYLSCAESGLATLTLNVEGKVGIIISIRRESDRTVDSGSQKSRWKELCRLSTQIGARLDLSDKCNAVSLGL